MSKNITLALYGCGLCHNPPDYMCDNCKDVGNDSEAQADEPRRSINGTAVPADFIYV